MKNRSLLLSILALGGLMLTLPFQSEAQSGEKLFQQNCASCHKIGGGRLVGPDLANVNDRRDKNWLYSFIKSSSSMIEEGDSIAKAQYKKFNKTRMPDQNLSNKEIDAVLSYIEKESPDQSEQKATAQDSQKDQKKEQAPKIAGQAKVGIKLFTGRKRFKNGGPSCVTCHHVKNDKILVGGGRYAKDLTRAHDRLGEAGIRGMLKNPGFPEMKEAYDDDTLTQKEIAHLTAFLKKADEERLSQAGMDMSGGFLIWGGIIGILIAFGIIALVWSKRRRNPVEHKIFKRQSEG